MELLWYLDDDEPQFERRLSNLKDDAKHDAQHVLQLSDGWSDALQLHDARVMTTLAGSGTEGWSRRTDRAWINLGELLRCLRLSPMPLLHALFRLGDQMSKAIQSVETYLALYPRGRLKLPELTDDEPEGHDQMHGSYSSRRDGPSEFETATAAVAIGVPYGMKLAAFIDPLMTGLFAGAQLADRIRPRDHLIIIQGVVDWMPTMLCDPLALPPSLCKKLNVFELPGHATSATTMIDAIQRALQPRFVSECDPAETSCILNLVHFLRCLEYFVQVHQRNHGELLSAWAPSMKALLSRMTLQSCTPDLSPAVTIHLPEAQRKAKARYARSQAPQSDAPPTESETKFAALCQKQEREALCKGEVWAQDMRLLREELFNDLVSRCDLSVRNKAGSIPSLDELCRGRNHRTADDRAQSQVKVLKTTRTDRRGRLGLSVQHSAVPAAKRKEMQLTVEKRGWLWPWLSPAQASAPRLNLSDARSSTAADADTSQAQHSSHTLNATPVPLGADSEEQPRKKRKV